MASRVFCAMSITALLTAAASAASQPNIVMIMSDDQDLHMNSMDYMDKVQELIAQQGTTFNNHYVHTSQCCPSRATIWTGRYAHNTNITNVPNNVPGGGWTHVQNNGLHDTGVPVWLQAAGYNTYYSGKLYNGMDSNNYCNPVCPEGWTISDFLVDPRTYAYYNSTFQHNEQDDHSTPQKITGYATDLISNYTTGYIDHAVDSGKPFFVVAATIAPHISIDVQYTDNLTWCGTDHCLTTRYPFPVPKKEYETLYQGAFIPETTSFNPSNRTGVAAVWNLDQLNDTNVAFLHEFHRTRLRTLKSVDELVEAVVNKLDERGVLDSTYIIYTSDNGFHIGQHRLQPGKLQCFEEDINVPFVVRGPNISSNTTSDIISGHVDLAPTILTLAGAQLDDSWELDGQALTFPLDGTASRGDSIHAEFWGPFSQEAKYLHVGVHSTDTQIYKTIRLISADGGASYNLMYAVWCQDSAHELYDLSWDPYQISNLHPDAPSEDGAENAYAGGITTLLGRPIWQVIHRLDALILVSKTCKTDTCRQPWAQLHPSGNVTSLTDALNEQYDEFYEKSYELGKVGWEQCYTGNKASLYDLDNEKPLWEEVKGSILGTGNGTDGEGKAVTSSSVAFRRTEPGLLVSGLEWAFNLALFL